MKTIVSIFIYSFISLSASAQLVFKECNPMIESLKEVVYIVRQDYALEDSSGELFGQNGNNYFGYAIGPGVAVDGALVYSQVTRKPFLADTSYKEYGENYTPVSTNVYIKKLQKEHMEKVETKVIEEISHNSVIRDSSASMPSPSNLPVKDSMDCVVVTFLAKNKSNLERSYYELSYVHNSVKWNTNKGKLSNNQLGEDAVFGLLFYENIGHGEVGYVLGGFVEEVDKNWIVTKYQKLKPLTQNKNETKGQRKGRKK